MICFFMVALAGCATMILEGDGQKGPGKKLQTVHGSYYGFVWSEPKVKVCDNSHGLYRVSYHTNALYALASLASLGLYVPQTAEWWCDETPNQE